MQNRRSRAVCNILSFALTALFAFAVQNSAYGQTSENCDQAAFSGALSEASATLNALNDANKRAFQAKLQGLKARAGWSDSDYSEKARPYVQDERIAAFEAKNQALIAKVKSLGADGAAGPEKRCEMLTELKGIMAEIVRNAGEKWSHMVAKVNSALASSVSAASIGQ